MPPKRSLEEDETQDGHPSKTVRQQPESIAQQRGSPRRPASQPGITLPSRPPIIPRSSGQTHGVPRPDNPASSNTSNSSKWFNLTNDIPFAPDFAAGLFDMRNLLARGVYVPNPQVSQPASSLDSDVEMKNDKDAELDRSASAPSTSSEPMPTTVSSLPDAVPHPQEKVNSDDGPGERPIGQDSYEWIDHAEYRPNEYPSTAGASTTSPGFTSSVPAHIGDDASPDILEETSSRSPTPTPTNPQDPATKDKHRYAGQTSTLHMQDRNHDSSGDRREQGHSQQPYTFRNASSSKTTSSSSPLAPSGDNSVKPKDKGKQRAEDEASMPWPRSMGGYPASGQTSQTAAERTSALGNGQNTGQSSSTSPDLSKSSDPRVSAPQVHPGAMHSILTNMAAITDVAGLRTNVERIEGTLNTVQDQLKDIQDKLPAGSVNASTADTQTRRRVKKPKTYDAPDPYIHHKQRNRVKKVVRKHLLLLLKIESLNGIHTCAACRPLSEVQRLRFVAQQPGCTQITPEDFRLDFSQPRDSPFNQTAISVFAKDLHEKIMRDHWYRVEYNDSQPLDPRIVTVEYLEYILYHHLKHVKEVWTVGGDPERISTHQKSAARSQRKQTLHKMRLDVVTRNPHLERHRPLLLSMRAQADSSDEEISQPTRPGMHRQYRRIHPVWRSRELAQFLWKIDEIAFQQRQPKTGCRRIRGAAPRVRLPALDRNTDTVAPEGLPRNCYDEGWIKTLWPHELRALNVLPYDHDFSVSDVTFGEMPGGPSAPSSNVVVEEVDEV